MGDKTSVVCRAKKQLFNNAPFPGHLKVSAYEESSALIVNSKYEIGTDLHGIQISMHCFVLIFATKQESPVAVKHVFCVTSAEVFVLVQCCLLAMP